MPQAMQSLSCLRPMREFDPSEPVAVHDRATDRMLPWSPDFQLSYWRNAREIGPGIVTFEGLLLDGWTETAEPDTLLN
jgi:hypothetical protein